MKIITTDYANQIFWKEEKTETKEIGCMNLIKPYSDYKKQQIKGFGGAFTEAAGYCYEKLPGEKKEEFLQAYFGKEGLNYHLGRTHINSCDFALGNYAAVKDESDEDFSTFDLTRANRYVMPLIQDAIKVLDGKLVFLLSPWSPPAFMKTNGEMNNGGQLKKEYYEKWADYMVLYIRELQKEGMDIQYLTVQNEPEAVQTWDSCVYHAGEEMEFVRDYLGPAVEKSGLPVKILIWDHNKEIVYDRAKEILQDEDAASYIYGIAVHWYTGDHFQGLSMVKESFPDKEIFFTEGCVEYSRFMDSNETAKAEMYAHDMIGNFNHGVSAFFDWNLMLDAEGGPNHVGNLCAAPVMATEDGMDFEKRLSYYYIGHFSRFVEPGACVVSVSSFCQEVEVCGFVNPSGERVLVMLNRQDRDIPVTVGENGMGCDLVVKGHSIVTVCF